MSLDLFKERLAKARKEKDLPRRSWQNVLE